ncbi:hypothetical protein PybrP1_003368 [[Pythium] brassicae (nom. inval.)]|nr:hypothetical protein PybrP1_003368 [[Pythium] brassicae (nom. inval.)]
MTLELLDDDVLRLVLAWLTFRDRQSLSTVGRTAARSQLRQLVLSQSVLRLPPLQSIARVANGLHNSDAAWQAYCAHPFLRRLVSSETVAATRRVLVPLSVAQRLLALLQFAPLLESVRFYNDAVPATAKNAVKQVTVMDVGFVSVLTGLRALDLSTIKHVHCLDAIAVMTNLRTLDLSQTAIDGADAEALSHLQRLEVLDLKRTRVANLSFLTPLAENLRWLDVSGTRVGDFSPLTRLRNLAYLNMSRNFVEDAAPLRFLPALQTLKLCDTVSRGPLELVLNAPGLVACHLHDTMLSDVNFLLATPHLQYLDVRRTHDVPNLAPLAALAQLETLLIDDSVLALDGVDGELRRQANAQWAGRLQRLKHLRIDQLSAEIDDDEHLAYAYPIDGSILPHFVSLEVLESPSLTDFQPLHSIYDSLRELQLHNWTAEDLHQLALAPGAANLHSLKLALPSSPEVVDLYPLEAFEGLETLELIDVLFEDLAPLGSLQQLRKLNLVLKSRSKRQLARKYRREQDFSFLEALTQLEVLNLDGRVDFKDASPLARLRALKKLCLQGTKVSELSALVNASELVSLNVASTPVKQAAELLGRLPLLESLWIPEKVRCEELQDTSDRGFPRLRFLWHRDDFNCLWTRHRHVHAP